MSERTTIPGTAAALWPEPAKVSAGRGTEPGRLDYLVVPTLQNARYLVPADVPSAERMLASHGGSRLDKAARATWRRAHRAGIARRLPVSRLSIEPDPAGIEAYLADVVGEPVRIGVLLGPPRANRKPVVQIFGATGATVAFAKLGTTELTTGLLATEAAALTLLAGAATTSFKAPDLLHHGRWKDIPILVQRALPLAQSDLAPRVAPLDVMVEIARLQGVSYGRPNALAAATFDRWHGIDLTAFADLQVALDAVAEVPIGCWHGDFGPWNLGTDGVRVEVWDWERFAAGVPVGLDAAHYRTQRGVAAQLDPLPAWQAIRSDVGAVLVAADLDPDASAVVGGCYLLEIVARYRADAPAEPTAALRRRMSWLAAVAAVAVPDIARQTGRV